MKYWLIKSEGDCYSIDDLKKDKKTSWSGVRNFQARNYMRDSMTVGDLALFYHSNGSPSGVYGVAQVASVPHIDQGALDRNDEHYDPKSTKDKPIWECVDFAFVEKLAYPVSLETIKKDKNLAEMIVTKKGSRLSIQPVLEKHFRYILTLGKKA